MSFFPANLHLVCIDQSANKRRFYALSAQRTLFGEWVPVREWGRIGRAGRVRSDIHPSADKP